MFLGEWSTAQDMWNDFHGYRSWWDEEKKKCQLPLPEDMEVLLAYYVYEDYSGRAFVLYRQNGNLYEVSGSHCSCYGLEDQWAPEETTKGNLLYRMEHGQLGMEYLGNGKYGSAFADELREVLNGI